MFSLKETNMSAKEIIKAMQEDNLIAAKDLITQALYQKAGEAINSKKEEIEVIKTEAKKAPVTKKDDDGEGMDPVGHEDDDVDNDGDTDSSDKYLKNRRKTIKKAMKESYGVFSDVTPEQNALLNTVIDKIEVDAESYGLNDDMTYDHAKSTFATVKDFNSIERWADDYLTGE